MKTILNKLSDLREEAGDFQLGRAITVGLLLLGFFSASIYVLISSIP